MFDIDFCLKPKMDVIHYAQIHADVVYVSSLGRRADMCTILVEVFPYALSTAIARANAPA